MLYAGQFNDGMFPPELGHIGVRIEPDDGFAGCCPFHKRCLEGMASGPALFARWGMRAEELDDDHPSWPLEARYLSQAIASYILVLAPHRIIIGGGVMRQRRLLPMIRDNVRALLGSYIDVPALERNIDDYIVPPELGDKAGVLGAVALAQDLEALSKTEL
jgi:fructokinase